MRLIDADQIRIVYMPIAPFSAENDVHYEPIAYAWEIDRLPTVDAKPVIHAHWEKADSRFHRRLMQCSNCGNFLDMEGVNCGRGSANYCPNCGAKMDPMDS